MGILTGSEIDRAFKAGEIEISPYNPKRLNPNSYNLRLSKQLLVYKEKVLDAKQLNEHQFLEIPEEGIILEPGRLYLGATMERTSTEKYIPAIDGRSSYARLGLSVHLAAGFGDIGFEGHWTLELACIHPVRIYAGAEIAQIYYMVPVGETDRLYRSRKYNRNYGVQPSYAWLDFSE